MDAETAELMLAWKGSASKMRYVIKFSKESEIKFISHLDLMRTVQKIIKRSALPIEYSKGFNPHMSLSFAQPLAVGVYSFGEYMDINLNEELDEQYILNALNCNAPAGIKFHKAIKLVPDSEKKIPKSMAGVEGAAYKIEIRYKDVTELEKQMKKLEKQNNWVTMKKSKSSEKEEDIKPMFKELKYSISDNKLIIKALVSCGSRENLSPELIASFIKGNTTGADFDAFVDIVREETYGKIKGKYIPLHQYLKSFSR